MRGCSVLPAVAVAAVLVLSVLVAWQPMASGETVLEPVPAVAGPGLVGLWHLDEGSGSLAHDSAGNGNDGTVQSAVWTTGRFDGGLEFAGSEYVEIPNATGLNPGLLTVAAWVYPHSYGYYTSMVVKRHNADWSSPYIAYMLWLANDVANPGFALVVGGTNYDVIADGPIPMNAWTLLIGTYDGETARLYVNGTLAKSNADPSGPIDATSEPLYLGPALTSNHHFDGKLDEVAIFSRALSASEILAYYQSSAPIPAATPSAPQSLEALSGDGRVVLTWQAPASDGGGAIANYTVYRGTASGGESLLKVLGSTLTYTDQGLTNGQLYYYTVSATNLLGEGTLSTEVSATPLAPNTAPVASFTVSPSSGDTSTTFAFDASGSSDAEEATSALQVRWDWQDNSVWDTAWSTTKTIQHQYSVPGTYTIRLQLLDSGGLTAEVTRQVVVATPAVADTTRPSVAVSSPANHSTVTSAVVTITGTASDNVDVQKVELSLDGAAWVLATGTRSWSGTMTLAAGANNVYVRVTDTSGNTATMTLSITLQPAAGPGTQGLDSLTLAVIAAAVIAVGGVGTALLLLRRRRRTGGKP